jgi:spore germination protein YaaH
MSAVISDVARPRGPLARRLGATLLALVLVAGTGCVRRELSAWSPYWVPEGHAAFQKNADLFSSVNGFWYHVTGPTTVVSKVSASTRQSLTAKARAAGVPLYATIGDGTGRGVMAGILANPQLRTTHVATLVDFVLRNGFAGADIDYEVFAYTDPKSTWATTRPYWVAFVAELGTALRARGKKLIVTVPPIYDSLRSNTSGYWVYDYVGIAHYVDRLRIMAYELNVGQPGPGATYEWLNRIVSYAKRAVPASKIELGLATHGYDWVTGVTGTCPGTQPSGRVARRVVPAQQLATAKGATLVRHPTSHEVTFTYAEIRTGTGAAGEPVSCRVAHRVWYPDAYTLHRRTELARRNGLGGTVQWALGYEDPQQWPGLRHIAST